MAHRTCDDSYSDSPVFVSYRHNKSLISVISRPQIICLVDQYINMILAGHCVPVHVFCNEEQGYRLEGDW